MTGLKFYHLTCFNKVFSSLIVNAVWSCYIEDLLFAGSYAAYNYRGITNCWTYTVLILQVTFDNFKLLYSWSKNQKVQVIGIRK